MRQALNACVLLAFMVHYARTVRMGDFDWRKIFLKKNVEINLIVNKKY
jgi:hypothetical protein